MLPSLGLEVHDGRLIPFHDLPDAASRERETPAQHPEEYDAQAEYIDLCSVVLVVKELRCHVPWGPAGLKDLNVIDKRCEAKVNDFDLVVVSSPDE